MASKPFPPRKLGTPADVHIKQGQTIVLHDGANIIARMVAQKDTRFFTAWLAIVGPESEVNATVASLNLK